MVQPVYPELDSGAVGERQGGRFTVAMSHTNVRTEHTIRLMKHRKTTVEIDFLQLSRR